MSLHRYPPRTLMGDYARSGLGLALTFPPLMMFSPTMLITITLALTGALCGFFLLRTIERHRTIVSVDEDMISVSGIMAVSMRWEEVEKLELSYYSVKRDRSGGWMQLTLRKPGVTVKVDSRLEGFLDIVKRAARAGRERDVRVNPVTRANLAALRITGD